MFVNEKICFINFCIVIVYIFTKYLFLQKY